MNRMNLSNVKGVIFDMDGVLVDSERLYLRFWKEACLHLGYTMSDEQAMSLRSNSPETAIPKFEAWFGKALDYSRVRDLRRQLMASYIDANGVNLKPGAAELLTYLKARNIKVALATASPVKRAAYYLAPHGLFDQFDAVVSGTSVAKGKPAPDIYLMAAERLHLYPFQCMAVEDSPAGILSAHHAGCITVMIPDLTPPEKELLPMIDLVEDNLTDLTKWL